jgi:NADPH:quinone reductase-like Zn-dependent oxidoreductase
MIAAKPSNMSFEEAAGVPLVAITAWKALIDAGHLASGQRVLIHGGAGGVGSAAVQLAKARGAYVIATASPRNHDFLRSIGADEVIDYNAVEFEDVLDDLDMVVNTVDASTGERSLEVLKPGGMMVSVVGPTAAEKCAAANVRCAISDRRTGTPLGEVLAEFVKLAEAGQFRIHVDATFPLAEAAKAWDLNRQGHTRGKIVLLVSN